MDRVELIQKRVENNYERQQSLMLRDILFLLKMYKLVHEREKKYWEAANTAELRVEELEEELREIRNN